MYCCYIHDTLVLHCINLSYTRPEIILAQNDFFLYLDFFDLQTVLHLANY